MQLFMETVILSVITMMIYLFIYLLDILGEYEIQ